MSFAKLKSLISFVQAIEEKQAITFYSEGANYWPHFESLVYCLLFQLRTPVYYVTSDKRDPGLQLKHKIFASFYIGSELLRDWFFRNHKSKILVVTTPDLGKSRFKKSKNPCHYVYIPHSLVSMHMAYRHGAFDEFDTIFCAGPHHKKEMETISELNQIKNLQLVKYGYSRLDHILGLFSNGNTKFKHDNNPRHALVAPSWGKNGLIESGLGKIIVASLLQTGQIVTLRPHPETSKNSKNQITEILSRFSRHPNFYFEADNLSTTSFVESDYMISDWSGVALEYIIGMKKPVTFLDLPKKINNHRYIEVGIEPVESLIRVDVGKVVSPNDILRGEVDLFPGPVNAAKIKNLTKKYVYNVAKSDLVGATALNSMFNDVIAKSSP